MKAKRILDGTTKLPEIEVDDDDDDDDEEIAPYVPPEDVTEPRSENKTSYKKIFFRNFVIKLNLIQQVMKILKRASKMSLSII